MKARYLVTKAKKLEDRLRDLQFDLYQYKDELKAIKLNTLAEKVFDAGFQLDISHENMKDVWQEIENAFCSKITKSNE